MAGVCKSYLGLRSAFRQMRRAACGACVFFTFASVCALGVFVVWVCPGVSGCVVSHES